MPCEHTHGSDTSGTMVAGMTSVRAVEQTRMGIAAPLVSNIGWGVLPLYWHALSLLNRHRFNSDRGCHYRWPEWIRICKEHGLTRSMSAKGCSPDNAAAEGFFGRLKQEFFHKRSFAGVTMDEFIGMLDEYMVWYRDRRIKTEFGMSIMDRRRGLGLVA